MKGLSYKKEGAKFGICMDMGFKKIKRQKRIRSGYIFEELEIRGTTTLKLRMPNKV